MSTMTDLDLSPEAIALLRVLARRSPLEESQIAKELSAVIELTPDAVAARCESMVQQGLVERHPYGLRLSDAGAAALAEQGVAFGTEEEDDVGVPEHPLKPYDVAKLKVEQRPISVFQALRKIEKGEIVLDPEFQRAFVWDDVRQSRLIESILIRIPLPAFYLDATDEVRWSVVDGLQRLSTLYRFCRHDSFALTGLEFLSELAGLRFLELPQKYRVLIEDDTQLIFNNLLPGTPVRAKFTIFSRVNTGGMQLTPQEIRHALQQGPVTKLLRTLAHSPTFLESTGGALESLRMTDREVILRALSFMEFGVDQYRQFNDLNAFLVDSMEKFNARSPAQLDDLGRRFARALHSVHLMFGKYAYRKYYQRGGRRSPFNKALFEAWICGVLPYNSIELIARKTAIEDAFLRAMNEDSDFVKSITTSTGQFNAVKVRFSTIADLLGEAMRAN